MYALYDTPSMDNVMGMIMDPVAMGPLAFCRGRVFPAFDHNHILQMIKQ